MALQQSLESANQKRDAAVDKLSQDERVEVRQMLNSLHVRLVNFQEHLDERKRYSISQSLGVRSFSTIKLLILARTISEQLREFIHGA